MSRQYDVIDRRMSCTSLSKYSYYVIETGDYTDFLLWRELDLMQEACPDRYSEPLELLMVSLLYLDNGDIRFIINGAEDDVLKR